MPLSGKAFSFSVDLRFDRDRRATLSSGDRPPLPVAPPDGFPGGDPAAWTPEHLYLAGIASCTMLSFLAHADHRGVTVLDYAASVSGTIMRRPGDGRYAFVDVDLRPTVRVGSGQADLTREFLPKAERDCFITASTTAHVIVNWTIEEA